MQRWLLLLMILLLPLRGWAGDLMSVRMAVMGSIGQPIAAMSADCPMHTSAQAPAATDASDIRPATGMENCSSCELCIPMAELPSNDVRVLANVAHQAPLMRSLAYVSAALAPNVKPPSF